MFGRFKLPSIASPSKSVSWWRCYFSGQNLNTSSYRTGINIVAMTDADTVYHGYLDGNDSTGYSISWRRLYSESNPPSMINLSNVQLINWKSSFTLTTEDDGFYILFGHTCIYTVSKLSTSGNWVTKICNTSDDKVTASTASGSYTTTFETSDGGNMRFLIVKLN